MKWWVGARPENSWHRFLFTGWWTKIDGLPLVFGKEDGGLLIFLFPGKDACFQLLTAYSGQE